MPLPWSLYGGTQVWMGKRAHGLGCPWEGLPGGIGPGSLSVFPFPRAACSRMQRAVAQSPPSSVGPWPSCVGSLCLLVSLSSSLR